MKELALLTVHATAQPLVTNNDRIIMATARPDKDHVFALGDPWLYDEYRDGRKIPGEFENFRAGKDLARWLLQPDK